MQSKATTVEQYLAELPAERRSAIAAVRKVILKNLPKGYKEGMQYGMIGYFVPHSIYPAGYHCDPKQPLPFVCLASQKNYMSLYMGCVYGDTDDAAWFREAWAKSGKKLDMGKSCIRFKHLDALPLDVVGDAIQRFPVEKLIGIYQTALNRTPMKRADIAARTVAKKKAAASKAKRAAGAKSKKAAAGKRTGIKPLKKAPRR